MAQNVTPSGVEQASSKSNLQVVRQTFNQNSSKSYSTFETGNSVHVVLSVFAPSSLMQNVVVTDYLSAVAANSIKNISFTLGDGTQGTVSPNIDYRTLVIQFNLSQILQGENKIEYDYEVAK